MVSIEVSLSSMEAHSLLPEVGCTVVGLGGGVDSSQVTDEEAFVRRRETVGVVGVIL